MAGQGLVVGEWPKYVHGHINTIIDSQVLQYLNTQLLGYWIPITDDNLLEFSDTVPEIPVIYYTHILTLLLDVVVYALQ